MANATIGTVEYRDGGVIAVPVSFAENVIAPSKSVFRVERVSGDELTGVEYRLIGQNTAFALIFEMPPDRKGSFRVSASGDVYKVSSSEWDTVVLKDGNDMTIDHSESISYNTIAPRIVDWDIPANYTPGQIFDVKVALNVPTTGWHANNTFTEIFLEEGARLGTPSPYKWTGTPPTDSNLKTFLETALPDDLTSTDWEGLATPPGGHQGPWHGESGQYFLIRFSLVDANATGIFQMSLRDGGLRGPVS